MTETTSGTAQDAGRIKIRLESLSKRFPGQRETAVEDLTLEIPEGEIVILVGPSGCGKTTTMKMINRIIEPTSGRIVLDGEDVTKVNPDQLRRRIGYVIQQIGLFPHQTIAENIATVPKLLGWEKSRINERVDELLETVSMDPAEYRSRYPKELSGGQRQRVGVARAMSADPDVMLMDEPFGAIDPITRDRLQNEFLRLQEKMKKTIIFVTHDIDEAIKMGDRIAILRDRSRIAQFDTPERILVNPADDFVADFIGRGASLKRLSLSRVSDVELGDWPTVQEDAPRDEVARVLEASDRSAVLVLDERRRPLTWVNIEHLQRSTRPLREIGLPPDAVVEPRATLSDTLNELLTARYSIAIVVDEAGVYQGIVDIDTINESVRSMRSAEHERLRARAASEEGANPLMTPSSAAPVEAEGTTRAADPSAAYGGAPTAHRTLMGYLLTPLLLIAVLVGLYLYVGSQELSNGEQRRLNSTVIATATWEHIQLTLASTALVLLIAIPLGIFLTRPYARLVTPPALAFFNVGQAVPSIGLIALLAIVWDIGFWPAVVALVAYTVLPVLRNTMVGLRQVDSSVIESARGMGMTKAMVLVRIELPLAVPIIMAGLRTALTINVGTATLGTFIGAGGLGGLIVAGFVQNRPLITVVGAILVAILALTVDYVAGIAEEQLRPKGL